METILPYLTLIIAAATLVVTILLALRLKTVHYLLQQPVVKKMSPQLRLKPVRLDEAMDRNRNRDNRGERNEGRGERREGRPEGDRNRGERNEGRGERREGRPEGDRNRGERNEGRGERREGRPEGDRNRGERNEGRGERREGRPEGDRNRGERNENRGERREGRPEGDRNRGERNENRGERREGRPEGDRNRDNRGESPETSAPAAVAEAPAGQPPRRPLSTFNESVSETAAPAPARDQADATFVGGGDDVQHGRRTQLKKKPRFDFDESETPASV